MIKTKRINKKNSLTKDYLLKEIRKTGKECSEPTVKKLINDPIFLEKLSTLANEEVKKFQKVSKKKVKND
jgi:hypothetical protein